MERDNQPPQQENNHQRLPPPPPEFKDSVARQLAGTIVDDTYTSQVPSPTIGSRKNQRIWLIVIGTLAACVIITAITSSKEHYGFYVCRTYASNNLNRLALLFPGIIVFIATIWPIHPLKAAFAVIVLYGLIYLALVQVTCDQITEELMCIVPPCATITLSLAAFICGLRLHVMRRRHNSSTSTPTS